MTSLTSLAPEILTLIYHALQRNTSGENSRAAAHWVLSDAGPLHLAATCRTLRSIYVSRHVCSNLILELPAPDDSAPSPGHPNSKPFYEFWTRVDQNGPRSLVQKLRNMKGAADGKPLTRFMLDSKWWAWPREEMELCMDMWMDILRDVSEVFGDELSVVVMCQGESVQQDFRGYAPRGIREMEDLSILPKGYLNIATTPVMDLDEDVHIEAGSRLRTPREATDSFPRVKGHRQPSPPPRADLETAAPLALHVYLGYRQHGTDVLMSYALCMFASKNLRSFHFATDANNLNLVGHGRRPAQGQELYKIKNPYSYGNPWRHFLPSLSSACETLEEIVLDCSLFWSELGYALPHLKKLKKLDCEMALLHTEPMFPFELESKERAEERILKTCSLRDEIAQKERGLKKNKGKEWLDIGREGIVLPRIEPEVKTMNGSDPHSRFATVDLKVCVQVIRRRIAKSRR
ncbi:hypothetical protein LHYA1_G001922 [Lachnellula hyalina]|uniref:Uncharacterized protein n=1 Tax=Lachnellula hyalina TaxID=1316788 RepID=A0A8H8R527_9HELO|nr:uncharacterized protein LHYA1_G001922 [Lachnellula hyalina]TVY28574.1 hypothetical protein LHYA1_G001922 [Lachnellula hyalina]